MADEELVVDAVGMVEVDAPAFDPHPVFRGLTLAHHELPLGGGPRRQGEGVSSRQTSAS